jgi:hypothetical protein
MKEADEEADILSPPATPTGEALEALDDRQVVPVEEASEIAAIVQRVVASEGRDAEAVYDRWKQIVRSLFPHLEYY